MEQLFKKTNMMRILAYFFQNPYSEAYLREIARKTKISPATASSCLVSLEEMGLIARRKELHADFFKPCMGAAFKSLKAAYNVSLLSDANVIEKIREKSTGLSSILLYGSCARGEDDAGSDVDILVIAASCSLAPAELSRLLGREASIQKYTISAWKKISRENRAFYLEVIANSIALEGQKPVID